MEYDPDHDHHHSPSFRHRIKSSFCVSCCFAASYHVEPASPTSSSSSGSDDDGFHRKRLLSRSSPSSWIRSRAHHLPDRCASFFSKLGGARSGRRTTNTSEFRYDPYSYALNFEDDSSDDFPVRNFSSRLPPSPPPNARFPAAIC